MSRSWQKILSFLFIGNEHLRSLNATTPPHHTIGSRVSQKNNKRIITKATWPETKAGTPPRLAPALAPFCVSLGKRTSITEDLSVDMTYMTYIHTYTYMLCRLCCLCCRCFSSAEIFFCEAARRTREKSEGERRIAHGENHILGDERQRKKQGRN